MAAVILALTNFIHIASRTKFKKLTILTGRMEIVQFLNMTAVADALPQFARNLLSIYHLVQNFLGESSVSCFPTILMLFRLGKSCLNYLI